MNLPLAPLAAAVLGGVVALGVAAMPVGVLEGVVLDSGLPSVLAQAEPPLGATARLLLAAGAGGLVAALSWIGLFVLIGTRSIALGTQSPDGSEAPVAPVLRRADAHPDAPPRPPLLATRDLGTPFLEVRAPGSVDDTPKPLDMTPREPPLAEFGRPVGAPEQALEPLPLDSDLRAQPLPADFDQPLAAFDPAAIPERPVPPPVPLAPLRRTHAPVFEKRERFEVFELTPPRPKRAPAPRPAEAIAHSATEASVHALLERLERGVVQKSLRKTPVPTRADAERGLEEALATLRNLARSA